MGIVNDFSAKCPGRLAKTLLAVLLLLWGELGLTASVSILPKQDAINLGRMLFNSKALSRDRRVACASCHDSKHAYADPRTHSVGFSDRVGTRNAPSVIGVGSSDSFFWDGRRARLEDVVLDPITNPVEFGWHSTQELINTLRQDDAFQASMLDAFPNSRTPITLPQISQALSAFVRSLKAGTSKFELAVTKHAPLSPDAELGRDLFVKVAHCSECHQTDAVNAQFSDGKYHHSGIENPTQLALLGQLSQEVTELNLLGAALGAKVLTDPQWSSLGRFAVTHKPADIGAFRTPSLRNVAATAPYMHDGSIATLREAVDQEIYYRGFSQGRPINLSMAEREAIVSFLKTLTDVGVDVESPGP